MTDNDTTCSDATLPHNMLDAVYMTIPLHCTIFQSKRQVLIQRATLLHV